jgi:hypothetical protein
VSLTIRFLRWLLEPALPPPVPDVTDQCLSIVVDTIHGAAAVLAAHPEFDPVDYLHELADLIILTRPGALT